MAEHGSVYATLAKRQQYMSVVSLTHDGVEYAVHAQIVPVSLEMVHCFDKPSFFLKILNDSANQIFGIRHQTTNGVKVCSHCS